MPRHTPAHHFRRGNIFYFRQVIPADLREHFPTRELCFSLGTEKSQTARHKAIGLSAIMQPLFTQLREPCMTKEKSSALIQSVRHAAEKIRLQALHEERENALIDRLAAAHATRKTEAAGHATALEQNQQAHAAIVAALATQHAQTAVELARHKAAPAAHATAPATPEPTMLISEMAEYVKKAKLTGGDWNEKTADEYIAAAKLLIAVIGNKPAGAVTFPDVVDFISTIKKIPPHISKREKYKGKTLDEIIAMGDKPIAPEYVKKRIERVSTFFGFASTSPRFQ